MAEARSRAEISAIIRDIATKNDLVVTKSSDDEIRAERVAILAKWILGSRKTTYRMTCRLNDADRTIVLREAVVETAWGLPPPTLTVERWSVSGKSLSGTRADRAIGGGGTLDYAAFRTAVERAATEGGWTLRIELRLP